MLKGTVTETKFVSRYLQALRPRDLTMPKYRSNKTTHHMGGIRVLCVVALATFDLATARAGASRGIPALSSSRTSSHATLLRSRAIFPADSGRTIRARGGVLGC